MTIEPIFDDRLDLACVIARSHKFRVADLLMRKRKSDTEERSRNDTFMTGRDSDYKFLEQRMINLIRDLRDKGFKVWRYKIEDTIIDSKFSDGLELLEPAANRNR